MQDARTGKKSRSLYNKKASLSSRDNFTPDICSCNITSAGAEFGEFALTHTANVVFLPAPRIASVFGLFFSTATTNNRFDLLSVPTL